MSGLVEDHCTSTCILHLHVHQIRIHIHTRYRPGTQKTIMSDVDETSSLKPHMTSPSNTTVKHSQYNVFLIITICHFNVFRILLLYFPFLHFLILILEQDRKYGEIKHGTNGMTAQIRCILSNDVCFRCSHNMVNPGKRFYSWLKPVRVVDGCKCRNI